MFGTGLGLQHAVRRRLPTLHVEVFAFRSIGTFLSVGTQRRIGFIVIAIVPRDDRDQQRLETESRRVTDEREKEKRTCLVGNGSE